MALETILAGLSGGLLRLAPELLKWLDRKGERAHELAMFDKQVDLTRLQQQGQIQAAQTEADSAMAVAGLTALREAVKAQATPTGIRWIDGLSASVRPVWTYLVLLAWTSVKIIDVVMAAARDLPWADIRIYVWGPDDAAMIGMLGTYWFLDRTIRHIRNGK